MAADTVITSTLPDLGVAHIPGTGAPQSRRKSECINLETTGYSVMEVIETARQ